MSDIIHFKPLPFRASLIAAVVAAYGVLAAPPARAQTSAGLLVKPWPDKSQLFEGHADAFFFEAGHVHRTDSSTRLNQYESTGRFRVLPGNEISPRVGYDFFFLDTHINSARIPRQLSDESLAFGTGIFKKDNWVGGITVGGGYAGDKAFAEGDAWYVKSDLILAKQINKNDYLALGLDYDGHRSYYPDVPLPGIGYSHRFDPRLQVVIGAPYSSISWKPIDRLDIEAEYDLLTDLRGTITYEFIKHWSVFGGFDYRRTAFHVASEARDHRLLFIQRRAELGLQFKPAENFRASVGIGYGFWGEFRSGFDYRNSHALAYLSDEPYLHGGLELRF